LAARGWDSAALNESAGSSCRRRCGFAIGNGRKTDPVDANSVAMVALRTPGLVRVQVDEDLVVMGMLADRRDELGFGEPCRDPTLPIRQIVNDTMLREMLNSDWSPDQNW
jgi:hypothetical protein